MTSPIIQIPYLRPDPVHELPGALGAGGADLFRLAQMMQQRQEAQGRLGIQQQNVEELRGLRSAEEQKNILQARGLEQEQAARAKQREDRETALNKITDPDLRQKLGIMMNLGDLPAGARTAIAGTLFREQSPQMMASVAALVHAQMPLKLIGQLTGMTIPKEYEDWKAPPSPSVLLREQDRDLRRLTADYTETNRQVEQIDAHIRAHEQSVRKANPPPFEGFTKPEDATAYESRISQLVNQTMQRVLQTRADLIQKRQVIQDRIHLQAGFRDQAQSQIVSEDRINQIWQLIGGPGGGIGPAPAAADTSSTR